MFLWMPTGLGTCTNSLPGARGGNVSEQDVCQSFGRCHGLPA